MKGRKIKRSIRRKEFLTWYVQFPIIMLIPFLVLFWCAILL